ncbi:nucleoside triphosphate pyrophosphohydrolase [Haematospirillum sp. H1815]|uniref:nucleoside triphosphate pyrophosphohydrolase n=1 Tax=Haematospirillum sp. H1815 TaxID=2723108 RepID=UPI00143AA386|nr:nucleoside triphosphate pyrophosphohydrolase [Haematospirillum sp. H1815]NKD76474.1 nucleoside triphosphate pyrophosphohydrolase [Haematospirillum sp. H1815]
MSETASQGPVKDDLAPIDRLLAIMQRLRDPEQGCPWDLEQSWESLTRYTLEEAYEVVDAVERKDTASLRDELGDLLLQVVFYSQIATENKAFCFDDIAAGCANKMLRRHPHVFSSDSRVSSAAEQMGVWEDIKAKERKRVQADKVEDSALDGISRALPAVTRALKLQGRAARVGFDWADINDVLDKVIEEIGEVRDELDASPMIHRRLSDEIGDLLFSVINLARKVDIDPETALRQANAKFDRRFRQMESLLRGAGKTPENSELEVMESFWAQVKSQEK